MKINIRQRVLQRMGSNLPAWRGLILVVFGVSNLYVFMEWVFLVTKPSFMDMFSTLDKVRVLALGASSVASISLLLLGVLFLIGKAIKLRHFPHLYFWLVSLLPACMLGALILLLVDNFSYTVFSFGISTSRGAWRGVYAVLFLIFVGWSDWQVIGAAVTLETRWRNRRKQNFIWSGMGVWLVLGLVLPLIGNLNNFSVIASTNNPRISNKPNILWITGDGVSADHLSVYGYERNTTPYLITLAKTSFVVENAFTNSRDTIGSLVAMFTSKHPLQTRVLYPPDILQGEDAYQHLPGILQSNGYYTIQYGTPYYVDAYAINLLDGFDVADGRSMNKSAIFTQLDKYLPSDQAYFFYELGNRLIDRLRHIFFIKAMENPNDTVLNPAIQLTDNAKMTTFLDGLSEISQPFFIHLHLMGTHGAQFKPSKQVFSVGQDRTTQENWNIDFYDDAILDYDANIAKTIAGLEKQGLLENTIVIVTSDHAFHADQRQRIPLLIRFPGGKITGRIQSSVQEIDITPTILDYLGLRQPNWMTGHSFLEGDIENEYIYGVGVGPNAPNEQGVWTSLRSDPPFYQFGQISIVDCQRWFMINLTSTRFTSGEVDGFTIPCQDDEIISEEKAYDLLLAYLKDNGFDISSLEGLPLDKLKSGN